MNALVLIAHRYDWSLELLTSTSFITLALNVLYFALAVSVTTFCRSPSHWCAAVRLWACQISFELSVTADALVFVIYWLALAPRALLLGDPYLRRRAFDLGSVHMHVVDAVLISIEAAAGRMQVHRQHCLLLLLYVGVYGFWIWTYHLVHEPHTWPYFFLRLQPTLPLVYAALAAFLFVIYATCSAATDYKRRWAGLDLEGRVEHGLSWLWSPRPILT